MEVIGTVGLPGSGKGEAADVAREAGLPVVTMGDVIREACRERGLDPGEHHGEVAWALREEHGETAIADRTVDRVREAVDDAADAAVVDGLRSPAEVEVLESAFGEEFLVVAVDAPFDLRAERLGERGREATDRDREKLREREDRELGFGMGEVIAAADVTVDNTDTLAAFRGRIRRLLGAGPEALVDDDRVTVADGAVDAAVDAGGEA